VAKSPTELKPREASHRAGIGREGEVPHRSGVTGLLGDPGFLHELKATSEPSEVHCFGGIIDKLIFGSFRNSSRSFAEQKKYVLPSYVAVGAADGLNGGAQDSFAGSSEVCTITIPPLAPAIIMAGRSVRKIPPPTFARLPYVARSSFGTNPTETSAPNPALNPRSEGRYRV
jgi:hypothetical protein